MQVTHVQPQLIAMPSGNWTPLIVVDRPGKLAFLSGFTSRDEQGNVHGIGDIRAQTRRVCEMLRNVVQQAGGQLSDIVRVDVYTVDITHFGAIHEVRREFFPANPPASTMVQISRLVDERSLIEINAIAVLP